MATVQIYIGEVLAGEFSKRIVVDEVWNCRLHILAFQATSTGWALTLTKAADVPAAFFGDNITYTFQLTNTGAWPCRILGQR
jgi:hypothetical protein